MENLLPQMEPYKDQIAEFIVKLYHILQQKEYSDYLGWHSDTEIVIKHPKKVEEKVLPQFFRHRHLSSFIRQLNMYKFSKVIKLTKQKNHMYFKNPHFVRGLIQPLTHIKRNTTQNKQTQQSLNSQQKPQDQSNSLEQELKNQNTHSMLQANSFSQYKTFVQGKIRQIFEILKSLQSTQPDAKEQLVQPIAKCNQLLQINQSQISHNSFLNLQDSKNNTENMLVSMKFLPNMEQVFFPSSSHL